MRRELKMRMKLDAGPNWASRRRMKLDADPNWASRMKRASTRLKTSWAELRISTPLCQRAAIKADDGGMKTQ